MLKLLRPEIVPYASVEIVPAPHTHWCEWDRIQKRGSSIAACGEWALPGELSADPTCPECRRLLAMTAEEMFGVATPGAPVVQSPRGTIDYSEDAARADARAARRRR